MFLHVWAEHMSDNVKTLRSVKLKPINKQVKAMGRRATTGTLKMDFNCSSKIRWNAQSWTIQSPCNYWTNNMALLRPAKTATVPSNWPWLFPLNPSLFTTINHWLCASHEERSGHYTEGTSTDRLRIASSISALKSVCILH